MGKIRTTIISLPSGKRKLALTIALLTTWKEIPFKINENLPQSSFDSPGYIVYILEQVGIHIKRHPNTRLSDDIMSNFTQVNDPLSGDLIFFKGYIGSYGISTLQKVILQERE